VAVPPHRTRVSIPRPVFALAGGILLSSILGGCATSPKAFHFDWNIFFQSLFGANSLILFGLWLTVSIAVTSQILGVLLGVLAAVGRMSKLRGVRYLANFYVWFFRGTPLLVQIVILYYGLPIFGIYDWSTLTIGPVSIDGAIQAGVFALAVNEGAYMSEIVRAGILSIDPGQMEAAKSLGMNYGKAMRRIILPQAARVIVPPLGNEFNNMLKTTSLLVIISVPELFVIFDRINGTTFEPFPLFLACALWYLLLTTIWSFIQALIEQRLGAGYGAEQQPGIADRLFGLRGRSTNSELAPTGSRTR